MSFDAGSAGTSVLDEIAARVLWLATRIVDSANHDRGQDEVKVGGHQASSASMVHIMTALWFDHLDAGDRVSVKPHASPVLHAIEHLLGLLDPALLPTLRAKGGLQAYPSRTKDAVPVDFSTGSVGLGATAPLFAAAIRRYVDDHRGQPAPVSRFIAIVGDAELDEGNVWEALLDPAVAGLGNVMWVVDLNRQSLDRFVPGMKVRALQAAFASAGWQVLEAKYGKRLQAAFERKGGDQLRAAIDAMSNEDYQLLLRRPGEEIRGHLAGVDPACAKALTDVEDADLPSLLSDLGGHDVDELRRAFREADAATERSSVVFAYTVKGWGLPMAGDRMNHSALLSSDQMRELGRRLGVRPDQEWDRFGPDTPTGQLCDARASHLRRPDRTGFDDVPPVPQSTLGPPTTGRSSTQEGFGKAMAALAREPIGPRLVTMAPDVAVSTNLGGFINRVGVYVAADSARADAGDSLLRWEQSPKGQHIELGLSEMNLFGLLGQAGLSSDLSDHVLFPVGTVYDPFVCRGLDALIYACYSGSRFVLVGTPSGVTLAPEGGAHQSTITPSIGIELPGLTLAEPAYVTALDWMLSDGLARIADLGRPAESLYLRLTTRPLDQSPFVTAAERLGPDELRRQVLAGGYRLMDVNSGSDDEDRPLVQLAASGAVMPEVLEAAAILDDEGVAATVLDLTSAGRLHAGWAEARRSRIRNAGAATPAAHIETLLGKNRARVPIVTVHDASSHALSWLGSVHGAAVVPLGVDAFGQSGTIADLYDTFDLSADAIANAALLALD